jgi:hypothetical protein
VTTRSQRVDLFSREVKTPGGFKKLARRLGRRFIFPGDTTRSSAKRLLVFVVGWGVFLALLLWGGYRQGRLRGISDGLICGAILTVVALVLAQGVIRPPGPNGRDPY